MLDKNNNYRLDIQGLRCIAVMMVVIFHIKPSVLPGGYIGVDMFFVISGYLITKSIWTDLESGKFSFGHFYFKRIRRLLPAFLGMLIFCLASFYLIALPFELVDVGESTFASLFYYSNYYFYSKNDYFDQAIQYSPLLHTWSLSVEEQFYFLFPAILFISWKKSRRYILRIILVLVAISYLANLIILRIDQSFAFYSVFTRLWQFAIGAMLVFIKPLPDIPRKYIFEIIITLSLTAIAVGAFLFNKNSVVLELNAIVPTLATACIIFIHHTRLTKVGIFLTNRVFILIGLISYSLYLWHWPLIVFYKLHFSTAIGIAAAIKLVLVCVGAGYLSWYCLERPTNKIKLSMENIQLITAGIATTAIVVLASFYLIFSNGAPQRFNSHTLQYAKYLAYDIQGVSRGGECFMNSRYKNAEFNFENCLESNKSDKPTLLLLGDSHAAHYYNSIKNDLPDYYIAQANSSGCRPLLDESKANSCIELIDSVILSDFVSDEVDVVVLSGRWRNHEHEALIKTAEFLRNKNIIVIVLGPTIEYNLAVPRILAFSNSRTMSLSESQLRTNIRSNDKFDLQTKKRLLDLGAHYISVAEQFCDDNGCMMASDQGIPFQFDYGHLTPEGAKKVVVKIKDFLIP